VGLDCAAETDGASLASKQAKLGAMEETRSLRRSAGTDLRASSCGFPPIASSLPSVLLGARCGARCELPLIRGPSLVAAHTAAQGEDDGCHDDQEESAADLMRLQ
jgi:hypothetical protein